MTTYDDHLTEPTPLDAGEPTEPAQETEPLHPPRGALGRAFLIRIASVFAIISVVVVALGQVMFKRTFDTFERAAAIETLTRVESVLRRDNQTLKDLLVDYSNWDESYAFASRPSDSFLEENFTVASLRNIHVQAVLMLDLAGQPIAFRHSVNNELTSALPDVWKHVFTGRAAAEQCRTAQSDVVWADEALLTVAMAPIMNTAANLPARGCFMMIRQLDSEYRQSVAELVGVGFSLEKRADVWTEPMQREDGNWDARKLLSPWPVVLEVTYESTLMTERRHVMVMLTVGLVLLSLSAMVGLYALLHTMVVRRLVAFSALADEYRETKDWSITWPAKGRDEIDNLGYSLNELVKQLHWQVEHQATHDALTGLLNRQGLERVLSELPYHLMEKRSRTNCLILIDLDNFKIVNDGFGHDVGDALLCHVAHQLLATVRQGDLVARMGGDEFAVLLQSVSRESVEEFSRRILVSLRVPLVHGDLQVATTGSAGLAFCEGATSGAELIRHADLAMYQAKQLGRDVCAKFNDALKVEVQRRNMLAQALRQAVQDDAIQVVFQPVVDVAKARVVGMEALARWSVDGEAVPPSEFIPIAEETGLIGKLGMQVLAKSCSMVERLQRMGYQLSCSVNLSLRQFVEFDLVQDIPRVVNAHGLKPSSIHLEITETLVAESESALLQAMSELHAMGYQFMLDDFGTGNSSLYRLQALPFQTVKVDRSFVARLEQGDEVLVRTVRELARGLNMRVVAEGVETPTQLHALGALGVEFVQGYFIARPMSDAALLQWLGNSPYFVSQAV